MNISQKTTIKETLPHQIEGGSAELVANASSWHIKFTLFGPDGRYNPSYKQINSNDLLKYCEACSIAWKKLQFLLSDADTRSSQLTVDISEGISVVMNSYGRTGVAMMWHMLFTDDKSYKSFMSSLDLCFQRGSLLVKKCIELDAMNKDH